jgi:Soluble lytic murein transglycosylase and related regulatory proteins (some contain LysM/invasin domains)
MLAVAVFVVFALNLKNIVGYFYPKKYDAYISKYSSEYGLDPYLVRAMINVESHYDEDAESHMEAKGLMQITPSTGRWVADKLKIKNYNDEMLYDPEVNIKIGCWYLNYLRGEFRDFNSDIVLLLAAYNGGISNVKRWLKDDSLSKNGDTLNEIPFKETENYVNRVLNDYKIYKWLY